ncbi:MAG: hypothetical protein QOJ41_2226, partial [Acidobacteriaceae bacterium]|nr:hypothetical protein [Acidobacteriaceae bacterium]
NYTENYKIMFNKSKDEFTTIKEEDEYPEFSIKKRALFGL